MGKRRKARIAVLESLYSYEIHENHDSLSEIFEYCSKNNELDETVAEFGFSLFKKKSMKN